MKGEKAVEIFSLIKKNNLLPTKLEDLQPLSFIGQAAVKFYRDKIKLMDQLKMTEDQRKATLKDGQQAGEMLLDIETRIGEIAMKETRILGKPESSQPGRLSGSKPSGKPPKHERLNMNEKKMRQAQQIAKHPNIVAQIKAKAIENEDIPTKTAVLGEIKRRKQVEALGKAIKKRKKGPAINEVSIDDFVRNTMTQVQTTDKLLTALIGQTQHIENPRLKPILFERIDSLTKTITKLGEENGN